MTHLGLPVHERLVDLLLDGVMLRGIRFARDRGNSRNGDERREAQKTKQSRAHRDADTCNRTDADNCRAEHLTSPVPKRGCKCI